MSRSTNRIRKKSTKLADYESSEDLDISPKRKYSPAKFSQKMKMQKPQQMESDSTNSTDSDSDIDIKEDSMGFPEEWEENVDPTSLMDDDSDDSSQPSRDDNTYVSQANSLYFSEKKRNTSKESARSNKKKKVERKDKGKARFTAYMLWARATRPKIVQDKPMMDFAGVNKRLGEMWNLVPYAEKHNWKRKAKKMEAKGGDAGSSRQGGTMITTGTPGGRGGRRGATSAVARSNLKMAAAAKGGKTIAHHTQIGGAGNTPHPKGGGGSHRSQHQQPLSQNNTPARKKGNYQSPKSTKLSNLMMDISPPSLFKVTGTSPIDVAAHLKLLGESLNNIGQKLKEHEGQIAVSGSLSVLLDSMLCVLGPLACLSDQLDETRGAIPEDTMASILDNIAYIMPGIV